MSFTSAAPPEMATDELPPIDSIRGYSLALIGKLAGMSKRDAAQMIRDAGGNNVGDGPIDLGDGLRQLVNSGDREGPGLVASYRGGCWSQSQKTDEQGDYQRGTGEECASVRLAAHTLSIEPGC